MPWDQIWPVFLLLAISLLGNVVQALWQPILRVIRRRENLTEDNIMAMVEESEELGTIQSEEKELIENVFDFNNLSAYDVMVHRPDMVAIPVDEEVEDVLNTIRESGLSRFPVYGDHVDDVLGILSTREYLLNLHLPEKERKSLKDLLRPAYFVPESVQADVLFRDMQSKKIHMAVVIDEYGGTSGLVTLEDLLEELVGNIYDEFDPQEEQDIIPLEDGRWRVSGSADLEELAEAMEIDLPEEELDELDCDTVGGLVFSCLPVIPENGSRPVVEALGLRIQVEELCDRRVEWAFVEKAPGEEPAEKKNERHNDLSFEKQLEKQFERHMDKRSKEKAGSN